MASTEYLPREMDDQNDQSAHRPKMPQIVALTGGKGGVGKTSVAVNLALTMARQGQKVLLLDADTDLANVSILLGQYPEHTLEQAVNGECPLEDVVMEGPYGLHVIAGASGVQRCMDLDTADADAILDQLARLEQSYDLVLVDTAAGLRPAGLHMIALATFACVVVTPDPASLTDAFFLAESVAAAGLSSRSRGYSQHGGRCLPGTCGIPALRWCGSQASVYGSGIRWRHLAGRIHSALC